MLTSIKYGLPLALALATIGPFAGADDPTPKAARAANASMDAEEEDAGAENIIFATLCDRFDQARTKGRGPDKDSEAVQAGCLAAYQVNSPFTKNQEAGQSAHQMAQGVKAQAYDLVSRSIRAGIDPYP